MYSVRHRIPAGAAACL